MKQCAHCKQFKDEEEFAWHNKILKVRQKQCRDCMREFNRATYEKQGSERTEKLKQYNRLRIEAAQDFVWNYLATHPCVECGETDPRVLEFDHVSGGKKKNISDMVRGGHGIESIAAEIAKCEVRCANCHRRKTHTERGWYSR